MGKMNFAVFARKAPLKFHQMIETRCNVSRCIRGGHNIMIFSGHPVMEKTISIFNHWIRQTPFKYICKGLAKLAKWANIVKKWL